MIDTSFIQEKIKQDRERLREKYPDKLIFDGRFNSGYSNPFGDRTFCLLKQIGKDEFIIPENMEEICYIASNLD